MCEYCGTGPDCAVCGRGYHPGPHRTRRPAGLVHWLATLAWLAWVAGVTYLVTSGGW